MESLKSLVKDWGGPIVGFLSAWVLFELTEFRRRRIQKRTYRKALVAELDNLEIFLSTLLIRFSYGVGEPDQAVAELRWYLKEGRARWKFSSLPEEFSENLANKTDEELKNLLKRMKPVAQRQPVDVELPILDSILSAQASGFSIQEVELLSDLRWQIALLAREARMMDEFLMLTFTVTDPTNHEIVVQNRQRAEEGYRTRVGYTLKHLRETIKEINKPGVFLNT